MTAIGNAATGVGNMMKAIVFPSAALLLLSAGAAPRAGEVYEYDIVAPYLQRTDSIAAGAGNSKEVNSVTHMLDPWPPYAGNRRIPGNGERMVGAVERYRDVRKLSETPATLGHPSSGQIGSSTGTAAPAATSTTASPSAGR